MDIRYIYIYGLYIYIWVILKLSYIYMMLASGTWLLVLLLAASIQTGHGLGPQRSERRGCWRWDAWYIIHILHIPIGSMVLLYMLTWLGYMDGIRVTIYSIHGSYGILQYIHISYSYIYVLYIYVLYTYIYIYVLYIYPKKGRSNLPLALL